MKVLVLSTRVPFVHGGAEELSRNLVHQLRMAGHDAEEMKIPFSWTPRERLIHEMVISQSLHIANVDRVIALKFPVYLAPHPQKTIWLLHQFRQAYDLYDAGMSHLGDDEAGRAIRSAIKQADDEAFRTARRVFAISEAAKRVQYYNGVEAETLPAPLNDPELFQNTASEDYIFAGGRVGLAKRHPLLIEALQHAPGVRLVISGPPEVRETETELRALAKRCGVDHRVVFDLRFLPREEIAALVNRCRAAIYIPFDEDSAGYVTMEAFQAHKPVITSDDAGGLLDIVRDQETGLVVKPTPEALGAAMTDLFHNPCKSKRLGAAARSLLEARQYSWPKTLEKLLS